MKMHGPKNKITEFTQRPTHSLLSTFVTNVVITDVPIVAFCSHGCPGYQCYECSLVDMVMRTHRKYFTLRKFPILLFRE